MGTSTHFLFAKLSHNLMYGSMITMMFPMIIVASNIFFGNKKTAIQINVKVLLHIYFAMDYPSIYFSVVIV